MNALNLFYIDGRWVEPVGDSQRLDVVDPSTEQQVATLALGSEADVDRAIVAARQAFASFSLTTRQERLDLLDAIIAAYKARYADMATAITTEMGAPAKLAQKAQAGSGLGHFMQLRKVLEAYSFEETIGRSRVFREPIGVCGLITPWNWPVNQIACKVAPALAAGCTTVLKPSEVAPLSAQVFAEIMDAAGVPAGVFNMVHGDGPIVGAAIAGHESIDFVSFTGSTRAGRAVAMAAAHSIKRVAQELGGKSPNILLDDVDLERAVKGGVLACMNNSGQSCNAPTRMFVPAHMHDEAVSIAQKIADALVVGDPRDPNVKLGPLSGRAQFERVQALIAAGIEEGATLVTGGLGRPAGLTKGFYVKPTIFADVQNNMTVAQEEIFGPVLCILPYASDEEAIAMANDTPYGLSAYVSSGDLERARRVAARLRAGQVHLNGAPTDMAAPFGGYKQSGNGREWGQHGLEEFLETKAIMGYGS